MRNIFIFVCGFMLSISVSAQTCVGGSIITGDDKNRSFCISDKTMNWWTAHQWCKSNGRVLVHPDNLCNYDGESWFLAYYGCPNFLKAQTPRAVWTSLSLGDGKSVYFQSDRALLSRSWTERFSAICE